MCAVVVCCTWLYMLLTAADEGPLIHGLDALVEHYMAAADGLAVQLNSWYPGSLPPATARLHGSSTLLHRAAEAGESR